MESFERDRIVSLIGGKEIFHWLINLKKREYADSDKLHVDNRPMRVFKETNQTWASIQETNIAERSTLFFKFCKMRDWLDNNLVEKVEAWGIRGKTPKIFTSEKVRKILDFTPPKNEIRAYVAISAFTGIRNAEMQRLTWDKIKLEDREIILDSEITKTVFRRIVKIPENLAKWLEPYVWELGTKKKILSKGKTSLINKLHESLGKGNWIRNGLHHSAATYYFVLTKNAYLAVEQMWHAVDVLKQNYNGLARECDAIKYFKILPEG